MKTREKGNLGELIAMKEMVKRGYDVLLPTSDHVPFDFVAHKDGELIKVQVKARRNVDGKITDITLMKNNYYNSQGMKREAYNDSDWDWLLVVDVEAENVYKLVRDDFDVKVLTLRTEAPKNGQTKGIRMAENYLF